EGVAMQGEDGRGDGGQVAIGAERKADRLDRACRRALGLTEGFGEIGISGEQVDLPAAQVAQEMPQAPDIDVAAHPQRGPEICGNTRHLSRPDHGMREDVLHAAGSCAAACTAPAAPVARTSSERLAWRRCSASASDPAPSTAASGVPAKTGGMSSLKESLCTGIRPSATACAT